MASARYVDLMKQGFMKSPARKRGPKKVKPPQYLYVLHFNWANDWANSRQVCAFHATSVPEAKKFADGWALHHGHLQKDVAVEEITLEALPHYKVEIHDEWMR